MMRICFVENFSESHPDALIKALTDRGNTVVEKCDATCNVIFSASIFKMRDSQNAKRNHPHIPMVAYCWDFYKWAWLGKHDLPWHDYARFLKECDRVLVPSHAQQRRLKELTGIHSEVVHAAVPLYEAKGEDTGFVLDPLRYYPEENRDWAVKACEELEIPIIHTEHQYEEQAFRALVATCTFIICAVREASTGSQTLIEGLWNGKPSLISDSPYMGGADYLGPFKRTFKYDDYEDLKAKIKEMYYTPPKIDVKKAREYISSRFTDAVMARKLEEHFYGVQSTHSH